MSRRPWTSSTCWPEDRYLHNADGLIYSTEKEVMMQAYCMKCRAVREISNPEQITMKNGRPATRGTCPTCDTKVFKIGKG